MATALTLTVGQPIRRLLQAERGSDVELSVTVRNPDGSAHNGAGGRLQLCVRHLGSRDSVAYQLQGSSIGRYDLAFPRSDVRWWSDTMQWDAWFLSQREAPKPLASTSEIAVSPSIGPALEPDELMNANDYYTKAEIENLLAAVQPPDNLVDETELAAALEPLTTDLGEVQTQLAGVIEDGGSAPQLYSGRIVCRGAMSFASKLLTIPASALTAQGLGVNYRGTLGIRVCGDTTITGTQITRTCQFTVNHLSGGLDTPGYSRGADITIGVEPAVSGWDTTVRIASNGSGIEVLGLAPSGVAESRWTVEVWIASVVPLSIASAVDESPNVELSLPTTATSLQVPAQWALTSGITGVYVAPVAALPADPEWLSVAPPPATVTALAQGALTVHYCGRHATGVTAFKSASTNVVLDSVAPTVDSFALSTETGSLIATVTALTASEECTYYWNFTGTLPGTPTWESAPATITLPGWGPTTVYVWARDIAGNVSAVPRSTTVNVLESGTVYFEDNFDRADGPAGSAYFSAPTASTVPVIVNGHLTCTGDEWTFRGLACNPGVVVPANEYYVTIKLAAQTIGRASSGVAILRPPSLTPDAHGECIQLYNQENSMTTLHLSEAEAISNNVAADDPDTVTLNALPVSWTNATGLTEVWVTFHVGVVDGTQSVTLYANGVAHKRIPISAQHPGLQPGACLALWCGDMYGGAPIIYGALISDFLPEYGV